MKISRYNSEGYYDPTAYEAIRRIGQQQKNPAKPIVYICSPYAGDVEHNRKNAIRYCRFAVDHGAIPVAPHLFLPQFMSEETERDLALSMGIAFLKKCRELWVFGSTVSDGMRREIAKAKAIGMLIRYFTEDCKSKTKMEDT